MSCSNDWPSSLTSPGRADEPWVDIAGDHVALRDCSIRAAPGDGLRLTGAENAIEGGEVSACEGYGLVLDGSARVLGFRVAACRHGGLRAGGLGAESSTVCCCTTAARRWNVEFGSADLRFYHNLVYDNGGGLSARRLPHRPLGINNLLINNFATPLLSDRDVELSVRGDARIDHNIYFRHPGKDKLLRGLPYAQGVDLSPLATDNPFGLRLRVNGQLVTSLADQRLGGHV